MLKRRKECYKKNNSDVVSIEWLAIWIIKNFCINAYILKNIYGRLKVLDRKNISEPSIFQDLNNYR